LDQTQYRPGGRSSWPVTKESRGSNVQQAARTILNRLGNFERFRWKAPPGFILAGNNALFQSAQLYSPKPENLAKQRA
jgi:hypothetical protein